MTFRRHDSHIARRVLRWLADQDAPATVNQISSAIDRSMSAVTKAMTRHPDVFLRVGHITKRGKPTQLWTAWEE